jgi:hypothetical protein
VERRPVVAEANNGGALVETVLRTIDRTLPLTLVHASRGKLTRAEPIAALYEQGKVHHVGGFPELEAIPLRWRDLELDGSRPVVKVRRAFVKGRMGPPKSKYGKRDIPIDGALVVELRRRRSDSERPGDDDLVFPATNGELLRQENLRRRVLDPTAEEAGVPWAGFHTFRHTCATRLFAEGRNAVQVQRWLGHHSPAFTLATYVHLLDGDLGGPLSIPMSANVPHAVAEPALLAA